MHFKILGAILDIESIAAGTALRERSGCGRPTVKVAGKKLKGTAEVELQDGTICHAEIHWYEAHGIGAKEYKIKRIFE